MFAILSNTVSPIDSYRIFMNWNRIFFANNKSHCAPFPIVDKITIVAGKKILLWMWNPHFIHKCAILTSFVSVKFSLYLHFHECDKITSAGKKLHREYLIFKHTDKSLDATTSLQQQNVCFKQFSCRKIGKMLDYMATNVGFEDLWRLWSIEYYWLCYDV